MAPTLRAVPYCGFDHRNWPDTYVAARCLICYEMNDLTLKDGQFVCKGRHLARVQLSKQEYFALAGELSIP